MSIQKGTSALVLNKKGEALVTKRQDNFAWVFPGGGISDQEIPEEAVKREIEEETGVKIKVIRLVGIYILDHFLLKRISFFFLAEKIRGKEKRQKGEVLEIRWVNSEELKSLVSKRHYQKYQTALSSDKRVKLAVEKKFPFSLHQLVLILWRRNLGKRSGLVRI